MRQKILDNYFSKKIDQLERRYKQVLKDPGSERYIHDLRTSIKRIKAYFKFLELANSDLDIKEWYGPFKSLFKDLGKSREEQVLTHIVGNNNLEIGHQKSNPPDFNKFKKHLNSDFFENLEKRIGKVFHKKSIKKRTVKYLDNRLSELRGIIELDEKKRSKKLHVLRKLLKELKYNLDFIALFSGSPTRNTDLARWFDNLIDQLGKWHDNRLALKSLSKKKSKILSLNGNLSELLKLKKKLTVKNNNLVKKINLLCFERQNLNHLYELQFQID